MRRDRHRFRGAIAALALLLAACAEVVTLQAPQIGDAQRRPPEQSLVYDAAGNRIGVLRQEFRDRVGLADVPQHLQDAVVVAEDRRFWHHRGVDARAIARAAAVNAAGGEIRQGGSTITQQVVKNLYLPDEPRTFRTKAHEALLARDLEEEMTKEEILEEYLNTVYFGSGAYGVQAAAYTYWRKDVADLDLAESALLAGLIRAPTTLDPHRAPDAARDRRDHVLEAMRAEGRADADAVAAAVARPVEVAERPSPPPSTHPYWIDFVVRTLLNDASFGDTEADRAARLYGGGLRIHTTLDPRVQDAAETTVGRFFDDPDDPEVAVAAVEPASGRIVASVGGRDHSQRQFDLATQGRRQPGSTFKTFVLTAALAKGYRPDTVVDGDEAVLRYGDGQRFRVRNYDRVSYGPLTLQEATRNSVNAAYARVALDIGMQSVVAAARALGVESPLGTNPAVALGGLREGVTPLEMAASHATLANQGTRVPPTPIDRIEAADGSVVWRPSTPARNAVAPDVAWVATQMLVDVVENGTGVHARLPGWEVAGKTGTTSGYVDAWFVGYTTDLAATVWLGYPDGNDRPLRDIGGEAVVTGGTWPARIWREFMAEALEGRRPSGFVLPDAASVEVEIDPETGLRAAPWCPGETRVMPRLLVPEETCPSPPPSPTSTPRTHGGSAADCPTDGPSPAPTTREQGCPTPPAESDQEPSDDDSPDAEPSGDRSPTPDGDGSTGGDEGPSPSPEDDTSPSGG